MIETVVLLSRKLLEEPSLLIDEMRQGRVVHFSDTGYTLAPSSGITAMGQVNDEAADMVSLRFDKTGVENTIFVSTKGYAQHAARIKIAVDPPDSFDPTSKTASMAISDYKITGEYLPPRIVEQAKQFIEQNREALISYWNFEIDTDELIRRLKASV